jgi:hypothetical protein
MLVGSAGVLGPQATSLAALAMPLQLISSMGPAVALSEEDREMLGSVRYVLDVLGHAQEVSRGRGGGGAGGRGRGQGQDAALRGLHGPAAWRAGGRRGALHAGHPGLAAAGAAAPRLAAGCCRDVSGQQHGPPADRRRQPSDG